MSNEELEVSIDEEVLRAISDMVVPIAVREARKEFEKNFSKATTSVITEALDSYFQGQTDTKLKKTKAYAESYRTIKPSIDTGLETFFTGVEYKFEDYRRMMEGLPFKYGDDQKYFDFVRRYRAEINFRLFEFSVKSAEDDAVKYNDRDLQRAFRTFRAFYMDEQRQSMAEIALVEGVDTRTSYRDLEKAIKEVAIRWFAEPLS